VSHSEDITICRGVLKTVRFTFVHGSNARNLSVELSLSRLAKMFCLS
jgi:hypothetical protein